jgi:hypothetical protein
MEDICSIAKLECNRCEYSWFPRTPVQPAACPGCKSRYWNKDKKRAERAKGETELECRYCQNKFQRRKGAVKAAIKHGKTKFFCSLKCHGEATKKRVILYCGNCGVEIERRECEITSKSGIQYCSKSCAITKNNTLYRSGENHPWWNGGGSSYRKIKPGDVCELCADKRYFLLIVHHKDSDRTNNTEENLCKLCYNCHKLQHMKLVDGELVVDWNSLTSEEVWRFYKNWVSNNCDFSGDWPSGMASASGAEERVFDSPIPDHV